MDFITIKESHNESDLLVLKSILESEGIECFLKNEFTTQVMSHMPTFVVELQVKATDIERVKRILEEIDKKWVAGNVDWIIDVDEDTLFNTSKASLNGFKTNEMIP